ncbi:MAG: ATP-binding protein [Bacteroidota bacterium]
MTEAPEILIIKSDKSELKKTEDFLLSFFRKNKLSEEHFNRVFLCLSEAVVNSIQHGNENDSNKQVSIQADCKKEFITIEISDEGEGFDYNNIENPILKKNIKKESGRGIHIIKSLSNELEFKDKGKCVQFKIECK